MILKKTKHLIEIDSMQCEDLSMFIFDLLIHESKEHDGDMISFDEKFKTHMETMDKFAQFAGIGSIVDELRRKVNPNIIKDNDGRKQSPRDNKVDDIEKGISKGH